MSAEIPSLIRKFRQFEHQIHILETRTLRDSLNDLGSKGWELVQTAPSFEQDKYTCYLKREILFE